MSDTPISPHPGTSSRVVSLSGIAPPVPHVNADVVERLEHLLERAKAGRIAGLVYGIVEPTRDIDTGWVGNASQHSMIAAADILHYRTLTELMSIG